MSDTPRTDDNRITFTSFSMTLEMVKADFARDLEREAKEAKAELKENEGVIAVWRGRTERAEAELARAMRVVEAVKSDIDLGLPTTRDVRIAFDNWEKGR